MLKYNFKKITPVLIMVLILSLIMVGCSSKSTPDTNTQKETSKDSDKITLKVAHVVNTGHPYHLGLLKFKEIVEAQTNGNISILIFPSGQLGNERDTVEALQLGTLDMCLTATAPLTGFEKKFMVFDLPFIFKSKEHAYEVLDGKIGEDVLKLLESKNIKGLSYFEVGFRNFTNSKHPINKPQDLKGMKFRLMETPVHLKSMEIWGGIPTPMAIGEVFTSLQQGTIDGQENPLPIIETYKFYEVQKYLSITEHFYSATPLLIQKKIWDKLTAEQQSILLEGAKAGRDVCREQNAKQEQVLLDQFKAKGMEVNSADKNAFFEASQAVYDYFAPELGQELIDQIIEIGK